MFNRLIGACIEAFLSKVEKALCEIVNLMADKPKILLETTPLVAVRLSILHLVICKGLQAKAQQPRLKNSGDF